MVTLIFGIFPYRNSAGERSHFIQDVELGYHAGCPIIEPGNNRLRQLCVNSQLLGIFQNKPDSKCC